MPPPLNDNRFLKTQIPWFMHNLLQLLSANISADRSLFARILAFHFTWHQHALLSAPRLTFPTPFITFPQVILWDCPPKSDSIVHSASAAKCHLTQQPSRGSINYRRSQGAGLVLSVMFIYLSQLAWDWVESVWLEIIIKNLKGVSFWQTHLKMTVPELQVWYVAQL